MNHQEPLPRSVLEGLSQVRAQIQRQVDTVERIVEGLNGGTLLGSDVIALLECLLADRLGPALQDLAAIEEAAALPRGDSR